MAHLLHVINIINNMSSKIENNTISIREINKKMMEGNVTAIAKSVMIDTPPPPPPFKGVEESTIEEIRNSIAQLEKNINDKIMKERMLIENTIMAKAEELVKRIVSEKVASETQLISSEIKMYVNELHDQESDTMSIAQSEIKSITQKKKGGKKTFDII